MTSDEERAWMAMALYCQAAEQATTVGDAPLDLQAWLEKHNQMWPPEFAWEDWSRYQPAIRKIHLVRKEEKSECFPGLFLSGSS